jgi:hypothetical protein
MGQTGLRDNLYVSKTDPQYPYSVFFWQEITSFPNEAHIQDYCYTGSNLSHLGCSPWNLNCSSKLYLVGQCHWFTYKFIKKYSSRWFLVCFWIRWFQLPIYLVVALGCYGLFMVGFGLMFFPTCPQEALLLQQVSYIYIYILTFSPWDYPWLNWRTM